MINYYEDLTLMEDLMQGSVRLNIFDFDGTIFYSPSPNPGLWDPKTIGKLKGELKMGGYGWYQNPLTLDDKYIDADAFVEDIVAEVNKSMSDPNSITVMLTGRTGEYEPQVKNLLHQKGLEFDEYGFKTGGTTMGFKQDFIRNLIVKYKPSRVTMWDDREKHVARFEKFLGEMQQAYPFIKGYNVVHVRSNEYYIDEHREKELVQRLMENPKIGVMEQEISKHQEEKKNRNERKPLFWAAYLYPESHGALVQSLASEIPEDWKIYAHHMTIAFGKPKSEGVMEYIRNNMGKDVELTAVELGRSDTVMAVKIRSDVPSDNKITHVTLAVSPQGKPVQSNFITDWKPLPAPIKLKAKIGAEYNK